jgi:hypothetical protein
VLRVSMVRIELCSMRTMGRSAWRGIVCGFWVSMGWVCVRRGRSACVGDSEVAIASMRTVGQQRVHRRYYSCLKYMDNYGMLYWGWR